MPTHTGYPNGTTVPAAQLGEIIDYVLAHRDGDGPFDIVTEGETPAHPAAAGEAVEPYRALGITWWVEKLGWWRGDVDAAFQRIDAGPPSTSAAGD